jgi:uncharacterized protein involved in exopolysaccharide biosynthesis
MLLKPPVYTANAKIVFNKDRTPLQISGKASVTKVTFLPHILQSEVELVKSREVLLAVAQKLLANNKGGKGPTILEIEETVSSLQRNIVPAAIPNTNVMQVTYYGRTPEEAQKTLELVVNQYIDQQSLVESGALKLLDFYQKNSERAEAELRQAEEELRKWEAENGTVSVKEQITGQLKMLDSHEAQLKKTQADVQAARARVATLSSLLSSQPERVVTSREQVMNPLVTRLKSDLVAAEVALQDLLQRYTEKDRRVIEKREQIALLKTELASAEKEREIMGRETTELNPVSEVIKKDLAAAQAYLTSLVSQREALQQQVYELSKRPTDLREKQVEVDRLSRHVNVRQEAFLTYARRLEEAQIRADLGKERLAELTVIEQPHVDTGTDLKQRVLMVLLAAFVGLTLGMAIVFGIEFFNRSLRTQADIEHYLGVPTLAAISDFRDRPLVLEGRVGS